MLPSLPPRPPHGTGWHLLFPGGPGGRESGTGGGVGSGAGTRRPTVRGRQRAPGLGLPRPGRLRHPGIGTLDGLFPGGSVTGPGLVLRHRPGHITAAVAAWGVSTLLRLVLG